MTQQGFAESDSLSNMNITGELSTSVTESPPQAQQGYAEPPLITMYSIQTQRMTVESDSQIHSSRIQQKKSLALHTAQGLSRRRWLSLALHTQGSETQQRRWRSLTLHTTTRLRDSAMKMAESGSSHQTLPGPQTQCRTGLSLASQLLGFYQL